MEGRTDRVRVDKGKYARWQIERSIDRKEIEGDQEIAKERCEVCAWHVRTCNGSPPSSSWHQLPPRSMMAFLRRPTSTLINTHEKWWMMCDFVFERYNWFQTQTRAMLATHTSNTWNKMMAIEVERENGMKIEKRGIIDVKTDKKSMQKRMYT